jgi:type IV pilus assembly protein PilM
LFLFSFFKKSTFIGLDINASSIRLIQLRHTKQGLHLEKAALCELPANVILDGKLRDFLAIKNAIQHVAEVTQSAGSQVAIALPNSSIITKQIKLSASLTFEECEAEIYLHLHQYFLGIDTALCFDFNIQTTDDSDHHITLVAARREQLEDYIHVVTEAGYHVQIVDVDSFALARASVKLSSISPIGILDMTPSTMQFLVVNGGKILFSQPFIVSAKASWEEWDAQLQHVFQVYTLSQQMPIQALFLSGKIMKELADYLRKVNSIPVNIVNPFLGMTMKESQDFTSIASQMWVSFGLALRGIKNNGN